MPERGQAGESQPPRPSGKQTGTWGVGGVAQCAAPPVPAPEGAGSTVSRSEGGPASLRRETPRAQRGTFRLCAVTLNQGQADGAGWDLRILRWGRGPGRG